MFVNTANHYLLKFIKLCYLALNLGRIGIQVFKRQVDITKPETGRALNKQWYCTSDRFFRVIMIVLTAEQVVRNSTFFCLLRGQLRTQTCVPQVIFFNWGSTSWFLSFVANTISVVNVWQRYGTLCDVDYGLQNNIYLPYFTLRLPRQLLSALETNSELKQYLCVNDLRAVSALQNGPPAKKKKTTTTTTKILIFFLESSRLDS